MTPNIQIAVQLCPERAADYKWFDLGNLPEKKQYTHAEVAQLVTQPLPFDSVALAGMDADGWVFGILINKEPEGAKHEHALRLETILTLPRDNNVGLLKEFLIFWMRPEQKDIVENLELAFENPGHYKSQDAIEMSKTCAMVFAWFMETIHQPNVEYKMYTATHKCNNAKRIRQGKKPLFDWHTVLVEPPKQKLPYQGGSHATPRLHEVRGHWVNRNGKRFWRKAHKRGDASLGVVFHDYKIKEEVRHG